MGFSFLFWQGLSISHSCACSPTDAPSVTNTELLSASSSSPFQANKFIHLVLCYLVLHCRVVKKKKKNSGGGIWAGDLVRPSHLGHSRVTLSRWEKKRRAQLLFYLHLDEDERSHSQGGVEFVFPKKISHRQDQIWLELLFSLNQ